MKFILKVKNKAPKTNHTTTIGIEVPISNPNAAMGSQKINFAMTSTIGTKKSLICSPKFFVSPANMEFVNSNLQQVLEIEIDRL